MASTDSPRGMVERPRSDPKALGSRLKAERTVPDVVDEVIPVDPAIAAKRGRAAGRSAVKRNATNLYLPVVGRVTLPPPENLAWFGGMAALVAFDILEWPVAVVLGIGKLLSENRHNKIIQDLGEALEAAG